MTKLLNFSISEITGRTFELPYEKALEIAKEVKENNSFCKDFELNNETDIINLLLMEGLNGIEKYELSNDCFESNISDIKVYEGK